MTKIIEILKDIRPAVDWAGEEDLIDSGLLNSFDMITLIGELNNAFDINIGLEHLEPENFSSVDAIDALVKDLSGL